MMALFLERLRSSLACRTRGFSLCQSVQLVLVGLVIASGLGACAANPSYKNVSVSELRSAQTTHALILDVRQPEEYATGHVPGAKLLPLGEVEARASEVPTDQPVYVICHSGNRSRQASQTLAAKGKRDIRNVEGGILAWQQAGYPVEH